MKTIGRSILALAAALSFSACGTTPMLPRADGGGFLDGGGSTDGGVVSDGGGFTDGGVVTDGGGFTDGGASVDGGRPRDGGAGFDGGTRDGGARDGGTNTCEAAAAHFAESYPLMRGCSANEDCMTKPGVCASFMSECRYPIARAYSDRFDEFAAEALACRTGGVGCTPCAAPPPVRCAQGQCAAACSYVCGLDCICAKDAYGCDVPECATPRCPNAPGCYTVSLHADRVCHPASLPADSAGQVVATITSRNPPCTAIPLDCRARLENGKLVADPFASVSPDEDRIDCAPRDLVSSCTAPALPAGRYPLIVGGTPVGDVVVGIDTTPSDDCFDTAAPAPYTTCHADWTAAATAACIPDHTLSDTVTTVKLNLCGSCFLAPATCDVEVRNDIITLAPRVSTCECAVCGACSSQCTNVPLRCAIPPLHPGSYELRLTPMSSVRTLAVGANATPACP